MKTTPLQVSSPLEPAVQALDERDFKTQYDSFYKRYLKWCRSELQSRATDASTLDKEMLKLWLSGISNQPKADRIEHWLNKDTVAPQELKEWVRSNVLERKIQQALTDVPRDKSRWLQHKTRVAHV